MSEITTPAEPGTVDQLKEITKALEQAAVTLRFYAEFVSRLTDGKQSYPHGMNVENQVRVALAQWHIMEPDIRNTEALPIEAAMDILLELACTPTDGEIVEVGGDGEEHVMENDYAVRRLHTLIHDARAALSWASVAEDGLHCYQRTDEMKRRTAAKECAIRLATIYAEADDANGGGASIDWEDVDAVAVLALDALTPVETVEMIRAARAKNGKA